MHPMLNTAIKAARRAGTIINRASLELDRLQISRKGPRDYVTEVDRAAEEAIIDVLRTAYPDHAFLGEESGHPGGDTPEGALAANEWVIDPLDGTTNFIHGLPTYAVSIALRQFGQVTQAVIYDPARNELFTASRGGGAFLNDRRMRVSTQLKYHDALLGARWPGSIGPDEASQPRFMELARNCAGVRRTGSAVLDLAYVAAGRMDGFCGLGLKQWDMAAASLMVLEAGGLIGDLQGEQTWMETGNVIAATPKIFTQMLGYLRA
jgi:myo-inositol-1(or 4)-monophosphatase